MAANGIGAPPLPGEHPSPIPTPLSLRPCSGPVACNQQPQPWTPGQLLKLANPGCPTCWGTGLFRKLACNCVGETIFRRCFARYLSSLRTDPRGFNRTRQEYVADFERVARRTLADAEWGAFHAHFVRGIDTPQLRAIASHLMPRLGFVYRNIRPYPLFRTGAYFVKGNGVDLQDPDIRARQHLSRRAPHRVRV